jgi:GIY-YIG catalytic domain
MDALAITGVPTQVLNAVADYQKTYRHPDLHPLEVSGLYDLFPQEPTAVNAQFRWPEDQWPNAKKPGVYLIWDSDMSLRYVGRTTLLGKRLHNYFRDSAGPGSPCRIYHPGWKSRPRFVATIPVEKSFEAGSLEEYLMAALGDDGPKENATPYYAQWAQEDLGKL